MAPILVIAKALVETLLSDMVELSVRSFSCCKTHVAFIFVAFLHFVAIWSSFAAQLGGVT